MKATRDEIKATLIKNELSIDNNFDEIEFQISFVNNSGKYEICLYTKSKRLEYDHHHIRTIFESTLIYFHYEQLSINTVKEMFSDVKNIKNEYLFNDCINTYLDNYQNEIEITPLSNQEELEFIKRHIALEKKNFNIISNNTTLIKLFGKNYNHYCDLFSDYISFIESKYKLNTTSTINIVKPNTTNNSIHTEELSIQEKVEKEFYFMQFSDKKAKPILNEKDFSSLIVWVTYYFENNFEIPIINNPIQNIHTAKQNIFYAFKLLFKELHPNMEYEESLYLLIKSCFWKYRNDPISNISKQGEPDKYSEKTHKKG